MLWPNFNAFVAHCSAFDNCVALEEGGGMPLPAADAVAASEGGVVSAGPPCWASAVARLFIRMTVWQVDGLKARDWR